MTFSETSLAGAYVIDVECREDDRGIFGRCFCKDEFAARGLKTEIAQSNMSINRFRGTLRGMHFQVSPRAETKLVRCVRGALYDVIVDLRPDSSTYCHWFGVELTAENYRSVYVPEGFAHGFQTLQDDTEVFYQMFEFYAPEYAKGVRWDDPVFSVEWPLPDPIVSERDQNYQPFTMPAST